jgi:hypothetical protein
MANFYLSRRKMEAIKDNTIVLATNNNIKLEYISINTQTIPYGVYQMF